MNIGEHIVFLNEGVKEWEGPKEQLKDSDNEAVKKFIFASDIFKKNKAVEEIGAEEKKRENQ